MKMLQIIRGQIVQMKNNQYHKTAKGSKFRSSARDMITLSSSAFICPFLAFVTILLPSSNFFSMSRSNASIFFFASRSNASLFFFALSLYDFNISLRKSFYASNFFSASFF